MTEIIILLFLAAIIASLGSALYSMMQPRTEDSRTMAKALTWRIGLSLLLFLLLMVAGMMGWISPNQL